MVGHHTLVRKLLSDFRLGKAQFLSILLLNLLSMMLFAGLDGTWRGMDHTVAEHYRRYAMADFWMMGEGLGPLSRQKARAIDGVAAAQSRLSLEATADLPGHPALAVHLYAGVFEVNMPYVYEGELLDKADTFGCLLDFRFARARNIKPGDSLSLEAMDQRVEVIVRGLVGSPEYLYTARGMILDPKQYGFLIANVEMIPGAALFANELCILAEPQADVSVVGESIRQAFPATHLTLRADQASAAYFQSEVDTFRGVSAIFPFMFALIAVMVILTTMRRLISRQRLQIGLLHALGYSPGAILWHYLAFAFVPSFLGGGLWESCWAAP